MYTHTLTCGCLRGGDNPYESQHSTAHHVLSPPASIHPQFHGDSKDIHLRYAQRERLRRGHRLSPGKDIVTFQIIN